MIITQQKQTRPIVVIDGMNILIRNLFANDSITTDGVCVGGVVGFLKSLNCYVRDFVPSEVYILWEQGGGSSRRKSIYEGYKANRAKDQNTMKEIKSDRLDKKWIQSDSNNKSQQTQILISILKNLPVRQLYVSDCEADDLISYLVKNKFKNNNCRKIIVSSDKDFYQLLDDTNVNIFDPAKKIFITNKFVEEKYKISPNNFVLARAIVGDPSDNIPGVSGIGLPTIAKRFPEFLDETKDFFMEELFEICEQRIKEGSKIKVYSSILDDRISIERNWKLMNLGTNSMSASQLQKLDFSIDNFQPKIDKLALIKGLISNKIITDIDLDKFCSTMRMTLCV